MAKGLKKLSWLQAYASVYMVFLYAPVVLLPIFAFNESTVIAFPLSGFTTDWFASLKDNAALKSAVSNSLIVAVTTAMISTILGAFAARAGVRYRFPAKRGIMGLILLPLVLPEIIIAVALLVMLMRLGLSLSLWTVIVGHVLVCVPFSIAVLNSAFSGLDQSLEEASFDLGETAWGTFRRVTFPLPKVTKQLIEYLRDLLAARKFRAVVDRTYRLDQIADAYRYVETAQKTGIVVLDVAA